MNQDKNNKNRKRIVTTTGIPIHENGKLPPQSIEMEEAVLGAMLLENEAMETVISLLTPESFYKEQNGKVFTAMLSLYKKSEKIDILTVTQELKRTGELEWVGGSYYVSALTNRIASSANIEFHARIVQQKFLAREAIRVGTNMIKRAYDDTEDVFEVYQEGIGSMEGALDGVMRYEAKKFDAIFQDVMAENLAIIQGGETPGVPSHLRPLDKITNGWQQTDFIILAGRPGMGKTAIAIWLAALPALESNIPIGIFSLEMSSKQLVGRLAAGQSRINVGRFIRKQLTREEFQDINQKCIKLSQAPIYIDDTPGISLLSLRNKARKMVMVNGVKMIIIDYLQLMTLGVDKFNREQEISTISRGLKGLAKELNIPIIALSQLSRQVENRPGLSKKPQLSDLRESGAIEQDADMVIFAFRPEYYEFEEYEIDGNTLPAAGLLSLIIAKHRNGSLGEVILGFEPEYTKPMNYDWTNQCPEHVPVNTIKTVLPIKKESGTFVQRTEPTDDADQKPGLQENTGFLENKDNSGF